MAVLEISVREGQSLPLGARAIFNNGQSRVECQVRNFSITGARLALSNSVSLPDEFLLEIPGQQKAYRAGLRWKSRDAAGVKFLSEIMIGAEDIAATETTELEELRAEVERLRRSNNEMAEKLAERGFPLYCPSVN